jgi:hypothetical protein
MKEPKFGAVQTPQETRWWIYFALYFKQKMRSTKWGAEINKYLSNNARPFYPFFLTYIPLLDWDKTKLERERNNIYTKFSSNTRLTLFRDTYYTPSASSNKKDDQFS